MEVIPGRDVRSQLRKHFMRREAINVRNIFLWCQALPIFLDSLITAWGAILVSVTLILLFGEVSLFLVSWHTGQTINLLGGWIYRDFQTRLYFIFRLTSNWDFWFCLQIIPQAVCSRYGLAIGAKVAPAVQVLVWICFPVAYPISKVNSSAGFPFPDLAIYASVETNNWWYFNQLLDFLFGEGNEALFRRAELKTLVDLHGNEV